MEFGDAFILTDSLVRQCAGFQAAAPNIGPVIYLEGTRLQFHRSNDGWFYHRKGYLFWDGGGEAKVGDCRVFFDYIPEGIATVVSLQVGDWREFRDSFLPYRPIPFQWCQLTAEQERCALKHEGGKPLDHLTWQLKSHTRMGFIFCCTAQLCSKLGLTMPTPQINHLLHGNIDLQTCFERITPSVLKGVLRIRINCWMLMSTGLHIMLSILASADTKLRLNRPVVIATRLTIMSIACFMALLLSCTVIILENAGYQQAAALLYLKVVIGAVVFPALTFLQF